MKKMIKAAGIGLVILSSSLFANAAQAAEKIGYIHTSYIMNTMPQKETVVKKLQGNLKDERAELDKLKESITKKLEKLKRDSALMSADESQNLKVDISKERAEFDVKQDAFNRKGKAIERQAQIELGKLIQQAVEKLAKKEDYDLIIDVQALLYAKPELNLTEKVLEELK